MGTVSRNRAASLGFQALWVLLAVCAAARANMAGLALATDPSIDGQILPKQETVAEVVAETLEVRFEHDQLSRKPSYPYFGGIAPRAFVTARYELHNPSENRVELALAFPVVAGELRREDDLARRRLSPLPDGPPRGVGLGVKFAVSLDGKPLPFETVASESLMAGELPAWRAAIEVWMKLDGFIGEMLRRERTTEKDRMALKEYLTKQKGFSPTQATDFDNHLLAGGRPVLPNKWDDGYVCYLFHFLTPDAHSRVTAAFRNWRVDFQGIDPHSGKLYDTAGRLESWSGHGLERRISFATFRVTLGPGGRTRLAVSYDHLINGERTRGGEVEDARYQFQYILRTAELWKKFGPIDIRVLVPEHLKAAFSLPLAYKGLADGMLAFEGRVTRPQANLLVGLSPKVQNADFVEPREGLTLRTCVGWLRRYGEERRGPWADDYLLEYAAALAALRRSGNFDTYVKLREGADVATEEEWAFLLDKTPPEVYRLVVDTFPDTNGGHRAALMLLEEKYREAAFDATTLEAVEGDAGRFAAARPSGCMTPNAWYLLGLCRMRHDLKGAAEAFRNAAGPRAHWFLREQAEWFRDALGKATEGDATLLKEWAGCEIRNGFKLDYRRGYLAGRFGFPVNVSHGAAEYWRAYRAHADRPIAYAFLQRLCLESGPFRFERDERERRDALAALYERAAREETNAASLLRVRKQALARLGGIGVGHATGPVFDALGSWDTEMRGLAVGILDTSDEKGAARVTLGKIAAGKDTEMATEAALQLAEMREASAVPHLVRLLRHPKRDVAERASASLRTLTGQPFDHLSYAKSGEAREKIIAGWERWWDYRRPRPGASR